MKLLNIEVSGFKNLKNNFNLNLMTKAKVSDFDLSDEVLVVDENLYVNTSYILTGKNSSGKTTVLQLLDLVYELLRLGIVRGDKFIFKEDEVSLKVHFYSDGYIYFYEGILIRPFKSLIERSDYVSFKNEKLFRKKYFKTYAKHIFDLKYDLVKELNDLSNVSILEKAKFNKINHLALRVNNPFRLEDAFKLFDKLEHNKETTDIVVSLFDDSIESLSYDFKANEYTLIRNGKEFKYNKEEILRVTSEGTIKGIIMFSVSLVMLITGGVLLIDEIENSFHKNLIEHLVMLFMDKRINKRGTQLFFSTHYAEVLDVVRRSDNIFVLKNTGTIDIENLYKDHSFRSELLKSNIINDNNLDTLIKYDDIMKVKRAIINKVSNYN